MVSRVFERRAVIGMMAGSFATWGAGAARAQSDTLDLFGVPIPRKLVDSLKLPAKPLNMVRTIAAIYELEKQANAKGLPFSPLEAIKPPPLVAAEGSFYEASLPRLVALIDRSEGRDPETAEKAGALLADVHASQRTVPDALKQPLQLSTARDFASLKDEYRQLFAAATIKPEHQDAVAWQVALLKQSRLRYEGVGKDLGVPWYFIGAIHGLEASFNFRAHLHNGDFPLAQRTRQVPSGRPTVWLPPADWESSAKDALTLLRFANQTDWSLERTLYRLEAYNGFGYRRQRVASPYLWCYSQHYSAGKYVADGTWSATAKSRQCGAATLIRALLDTGEISFS